jgi:DNA-binding GntR family transcriptional regulator
LEQEGFVSRRPRAGTVVNGEAFGIQTWLSWQEPFIETLRRLGYHDARVELLSLQLRRLLPAEADWFGQPPGCSALQVRKRWRGGERVQMVSDYVVPVPGATTLSDVEGPEDPVFEVARRVSGEAPIWEVANVRAAVVTSEHAEDLEIEPEGAALVLDLVGVSSKGRRLYRIVERHIGDAVAFGFVRTFR